MNHGHIIITVFYYSLLTHGNNATVLTTQTASHLKKGQSLSVSLSTSVNKSANVDFNAYTNLIRIKELDYNPRSTFCS